ncbi:MAG: hypothetical protein JSW71_20940 [Gemmatimonadota bacterium]|nr:MAG: hypothetical protein JSW71_20940 [Gemmatimonadota bacterium]
MKPFAALALSLLALAQPAASQTHLVIVSGLGGDQAHREKFHRWAMTLIDAARQRFAVPEANITYLAEKESLDFESITARSTKENVQGTLAELAAGLEPGEGVLILLIGHGSYQGDRSLFSLPGPDMSAADFAIVLDQFTAQRVVLVNTTSASGDFVKELSAPGRTIITATKSPFERNETVFCQYFVQAFAEDVADVDKDERVSVLEAFNYARLELRRAYESDDRILTEHAQLDDNGDGEGSAEPDPSVADGALARQFVLEGADAATAVATADPQLAELLSRQRVLQQAVADLRGRKESIDPEVYGQELEGLLLELARVSRAIREREKGVEPR